MRDSRVVSAKAGTHNHRCLLCRHLKDAFESVQFRAIMCESCSAIEKTVLRVASRSQRKKTVA